MKVANTSFVTSLVVYFVLLEERLLPRFEINPVDFFGSVALRIIRLASSSHCTEGGAR